MTNKPKIRLLALHGKSTSGRIMLTQIKPLADALQDFVEIEYLDGGHSSPPFRNIATLFPQHDYQAWFVEPSVEQLTGAHRRILDCLRPKLKLPPWILNKEAISYQSGVDIDTELIRPPDGPVMTIHRQLSNASDDLGPDWEDFDWFSEDHYSGSKSMSSTGSSSRSSIGASIGGRMLSLERLDTRQSSWPSSGLDTPASAISDVPASMGSMPPFDGLICFSQGCAVATGMLLNQFQADEARHLGYPVRFVVLICGSRPPDGKMGFVSTPGSAPIALPSIHVQGLKDSALAEQKRLSALYDNRVKMVLELDIAHHPPRRTSDVDTVAEAIHKLIDTLEPREARP